jgi:hypothetical protein
MVGDPAESNLETAFSRSLRLLVEVGGVLTGIFYFVGWIFLVRLLDKFGVSPDEIGLTFSSLVVRSIFISVPLALIILGYLGLLELKYKLSPVMYSVLSITIGSLAAIAYAVWALNAVLVNIAVVLTLAALVISGLILAANLKEWHRLRRRRNSRIAVGSALLLAVLLLATPLQYASYVADQLESGHVGYFGPIPGTPVFRVEEVFVLEAGKDSPPEPLPIGCATLLGSANGITVVLLGYGDDPQIPWRLSTETINLRRGCR